MFIILLATGFFTSLIGTVAGSGGLIGMPVMLLAGLPVHSAIAVAKFSNTLSSFSSFSYLLKKKEIKWREALSILPFAFGGGLAGGITAGLLRERVMEFIAVFLLTSAFFISFVRKPSESADNPSTGLRGIGPSLTAIGFYDGMFGPGQATMLMHTFLYKALFYLLLSSKIWPEFTEIILISKKEKSYSPFQREKPLYQREKSGPLDFSDSNNLYEISFI
ncbi:sulfite exporter TauE/SafE family protein [Bacillus sp. SCS-153A]|uniref:sulfite exporter TauE/SafE family protein n=1 Tax=Rossellomorea sedimentorum TaxID=3115294 RepID=UPI003905D0F8